MRLLLLFVSSALARVTLNPLAGNVQDCSITFDGRIPKTKSLTDFDSQNGTPYQSAFVFASNYVKKWSNILLFPNTAGSYYDLVANAKPVEVTISDKSILEPEGSGKQVGVRRAELVAKTDKPAFTGVQTLHLSLLPDPSKPLNLSHEYQFFFMETTDYGANQLIIRAGAINGDNSNARTIRVTGNTKTNNKVLFEAEFASDWHNFAFELDFSRNTVRIYYSRGRNSLRPVTSTISNDLSGQGTLHFGLLKKSTGAGRNGQDYLYSGYHESNIDEGIIFGGIFEENGSFDCSNSAGVGK